MEGLTMEQLQQLTKDDMMRIELALEGHIETLRNRFDDDPRYKHPARAYEQLLEKIKRIND